MEFVAQGYGVYTRRHRPVVIVGEAAPSIEITNEWRAVFRVIERVLSPFPEALRAVVDGLAEHRKTRSGGPGHVP